MDALVERSVARLRREVPDAVAVYLGGSRLRGEAGPYSDVDFDVLVPQGPRDEWPSLLRQSWCCHRSRLMKDIGYRRNPG